MHAKEFFMYKKEWHIREKAYDILILVSQFKVILNQVISRKITDNS
jgi:hypothetical protein